MDVLRRHEHGGAEFIYVMAGTLRVHIGDTEYGLEVGDSIYFDPTVSHGYRRSGGRVCQALVVTTI